MKLKTEYGEYNVVLDVTHYSRMNNLALQLYIEETGEPFATITTNIYALPYDCVALDVNNCPWVETFLDEYGLLVRPIGIIPSGFCEYPVYQLDLEKLEQLTKGE